MPDLDHGLAFYRDQLGHELLWRNDAVGQAGLRLPESATELVLSTALEVGRGGGGPASAAGPTPLPAGNALLADADTGGSSRRGLV